MRYPASEKLEIVRIVEQSHLPAKRTLDQLGIPRRTFYRWYDRYLDGGPEALEDRSSAPSRVWNRIPDEVHDQIIELALDQSELSPRELAVCFTDEKSYFVSEATVYPPRQHSRDERRQLSSRPKPRPQGRLKPSQNRHARMRPPLGLRPPGSLMRAQRWPTFAPPLTMNPVFQRR